MIILLTAILTALLINGCDKVSELTQPSPEEVLRSYLDASLKGRTEEAYSHVSSEDKAVKSLEEYKAETDNKDNPFSTVLTSSVSFKIQNVTKTGSAANADVEITLPDMGVMLKDIMGAAFASAFSGKDNAELEQTIAKKYENGEVPTTTKNEEYHLLKENEGWKVFLDWKAQKAAKEKEQKIAALLADAKELRKSKKLQGAVKKYEEVLTLNSEMVEAKDSLKKTNQEIISYEEKQAYIKNVILKDFKVSEGKKYGFGDPVPGVFGTIVNKGDKSLKRVEITVYFLDKNGTVIGEKDFNPVLVSEYSFGDDNKPLKPNYVKDFGYSVEDSAPSSWSKKAKARITDIEFEK